MKISLQTKTAAGLALVGMLVLALAVMHYASQRAFLDSSHLVTHSHQVLEQLQALLAAVQDAETRQRGYLVTGKEAYLEPYNAALRRIETSYNELREVTADNPDQQRRLQGLAPLIAKKLNKLDEGIQLGKQQRLDAVVAVMDEGKETMDQIRALAAEMEQEEKQLLDRRQQTFNAHARQATLTSLGFTVLAFALLGIIYFVVLRDISARRLAEEQLQRANSSLLQANELLTQQMEEKRRSIKAFRESEERFRLLVEGVSDYAILILDPAGYVTSWNRGAERIKGYQAAEIMGKHFSCFYAPEDVERGTPELELKEAAGKGRCEGEGWRRRKNGSQFWATVLITALHDENGNLRGFSKITRDITERKQAEQALRAERQRFRDVLDRLPVYVVLLTKDYHVSLDNTVFRQRFGESHGRRCYEFLFNRDSPCEICETYTVLKTGSPHEWKWTGPDGRHYDVFDFPFTDSDGSPLILEMGLDVTERERAEAEVHRLNAELEQRVIQRTAQLETANKELEAFTYSVSHDLRAPLRHISGFSKILTEEFGERLPEEAQHHLHRIDEGTRRMGALVDDLLNLARVGRRELDLRVTGLRSVIDEVMADLKPEVQGRDIEWKIGPLPYVECDPGLMKQVFQNLLSNAVKFTGPREHAVIELGQLESDGTPVVYVRDNGVGFSMKYADKLFGVFQRLHRSEDFEGTGVGLATVHRIIQKHGGRIWAEAELDKGATFYFTIGKSESRGMERKTTAAGA